MRTSFRWLAAAVVSSMIGMTAWAIELPPGFVQTTFIKGNQPVRTGPTAIEWAPDGDFWVARTKGQVFVLRDEVLTKTLDLYGPTFPGSGEQGLHNIALDPDYATNKHIWIYYTHFEEGEPTFNRLSRFTNVDDSLVNETVMLEGPDVQSSIHNGGCLAFASDKTLFLAMGEDAMASKGQNTFDIRGSIMHLNRDGTPAADNPFLDGSAGDPRVWAYGVRNPFRCSIQPETDNLFVADVGNALWEEVSIAYAGANLGWGLVEGPQPPGIAGMTYPLYSYPHNGEGAAVVAGAHVEPGVFPPDYEGNFFFGDWWTEEMYRMVLDGDTDLVSVETWGTGLGKLVDFEFGPDGALYYVSRQTFETSVGRIEYVGGENSQPSAVGTATPDNGLAPLTVTLDGSGSTDPDDDTLTYDWDFGDTGSSTSEVIAHEYALGVYEATLTVDDGNGLSATTQPIRIVSGNRRPAANVVAPVNGTMYDAGQTFNYSGVGTDPEEGNLACSQFTWRVIFHHDAHTHPYLGPIQGSCGGSFDTATTGETSANVWYEVRLEVADTGQPIGAEAVLTGEHSTGILPNTSEMTFATLPLTDLDLELDSTPFTAPQVVEGVVNVTRQIGAVDGQIRAGHTYTWLSWSDGGAIEHAISTPAINTTYTATFGCDVIVEAEQLRVDKMENDDLELRWLPVPDPCLATGAERYRVYRADTARPSSAPGSFPTDPAWTLVGSTDEENLDIAAPPGDAYFLVVPVGTDGLDGAVGHYGE